MKTLEVCLDLLEKAIDDADEVIHGTWGEGWLIGLAAQCLFEPFHQVGNLCRVEYFAVQMELFEPSRRFLCDH